MKVVIVALLSALAVYGQSAIKLAISEGAVQTLLTYLEETEGKQLSVLELGNYTYDIGGGAKVEINNTVAHTNISFKHPNIFFQAPNVVNLNFTNLSSIVYFNYTEIEGIVKIHGYGNMTVPSVNLTIEAVFDESEGSLTIDLPSIVAYIANVTLVTGSVFNKALEDKINSDLWLIELVIPQLITQYLPKINLILAGITKYLPIPQLGVMFDIHVVDDPVIEMDNAVLALKGEVLSYPYREPVGAFNPPDLPSVSDAFTLQAMFSDYILQTLAAGFWSVANFNITSLPSGLPIKLTTDGLAFLLPGLKKVYGPGKNVTLGVSKSSEYPTISINTTPDEVLNITVGLKLNFYVVINSSYSDYALELDSIIGLYLNASIVNFQGNFTVDGMKLMDFTDTNSKIPIDMFLLEKLLVALFKTIIPILNVVLVNIPIPHPEILNILRETAVLVKNGFLLFGIDL